MLRSVQGEPNNVFQSMLEMVFRLNAENVIDQVIERARAELGSQLLDTSGSTGAAAAS